MGQGLRLTALWFNCFGLSASFFSIMHTLMLSSVFSLCFICAESCGKADFTHLRIVKLFD